MDYCSLLGVVNPVRTIRSNPSRRTRAHEHACSCTPAATPTQALAFLCQDCGAFTKTFACECEAKILAGLCHRSGLRSARLACMLSCGIVLKMAGEGTRGLHHTAEDQPQYGRAAIPGLSVRLVAHPALFQRSFGQDRISTCDLKGSEAGCVRCGWVGSTSLLRALTRAAAARRSHAALPQLACPYAPHQRPYGPLFVGNSLLMASWRFSTPCIRASTLRACPRSCLAVERLVEIWNEIVVLGEEAHAIDSREAVRRCERARVEGAPRHEAASRRNRVRFS